MKILSLVIAFILLFPLYGAAVDDLKPNLTSTNQLPVWVPNDSDIKEYMLRIFNAAIDMVNIKRSPYVLVAARIEDGWVYVTAKRHTLVEEIKIGKFEKIKEVSIEDGLFKVKYQSERSFGWKEFGIGTGAGIVLTIIVKALCK